MDSIVNLGIPHIGEQIFQNLKMDDLLQCLEVSSAWKTLAMNVFPFDQWKGKLNEAVLRGYFNIVKVLFEHPKSMEIDWNQRDLLRRGQTAKTLT